MQRYLTILIFVFFSLSCQAQEKVKKPVSTKNRPLISAQETLAKIRKLKLKKEVKKFKYCEPGTDTKRTLLYEEVITAKLHNSPIPKTKQVARIYMIENGSEDSAAKIKYYYDQKGNLIHLFAELGAVNGTEVDHKVYFSNDGKRLKEEQKTIKGPGYSFPKKWEEQLVVRNPLKHFHSKNECPEEK